MTLFRVTLPDLPPIIPVQAECYDSWLAGRKGKRMKCKRHSAEQIISKLREAEVLLQKGQAVPQVCRQLGVTAQTYYRWRKEYGGMRADQAKRLKDLEKENTQLKKIVADQALDMAILKDVASGKF